MITGYKLDFLPPLPAGATPQEKERYAGAQLAHLDAQLDAMDLPPMGKGERRPSLISDHKSDDEMTEAEWNEDLATLLIFGRRVDRIIETAAARYLQGDRSFAAHACWTYWNNEHVLKQPRPWPMTTEY